MSFRTNRDGIELRGEEKTYTSGSQTCKVYKISLRPTTQAKQLIEMTFFYL